MDYRFSLPIQWLYDRFYRGSLGCQYGLPVCNHQTRNSQLYDEPVNRFLNHSFCIGSNLFLMPLFFACSSLDHDTRNDHRATLRCLGQWNIQSFFAKPIDTLCNKKHIFLPWNVTDKHSSRKFHKRTVRVLHIVGVFFLLAYFLFAKMLHSFYCKMSCLSFQPFLLGVQLFCHTMSNGLLAFGFAPYPYKQCRNIFVLGGLSVVENVFCNAHMVLESVFGGIYSHTKSNKNELHDLRVL